MYLLHSEADGFMFDNDFGLQFGMAYGSKYSNNQYWSELEVPNKNKTLKKPFIVAIGAKTLH